MTERDIFIAALQQEDPTRRRAYLDEACAQRPDLRRQIENLLELHEGAASFLEQPAAEPMATGAFPDGVEPGVSLESAGTSIGPYRLLEAIGEGGMGTVWLAQQQEPVKRLVALKIIKAGMDSRLVLARFEAERQALALMDHPHIARVFDGGATPGGRPYFVMELVKGVPITHYCDEHRLTLYERLGLFVQVCQAVQHAHQKGIIHRDLKPSNILVAPYDGQPVVKVIDFGVAKAAGQPLTEKTLVTGFGALVGTPEYMSPEQAELNNHDIDTRSDVYSLGVLLYELLTGTTPLTRQRVKETALLEVLRQVREQEPPRPSTRLGESRDSLTSISAQRRTEPTRLTRQVRGDLDWIVMKALEKDRSRRYESANGFAMDVQRFLADEPVQACPPSVRYRLRKFVRRNRRAISTLALVGGVLLMAVVAVAGSIGWVARDRAAVEEEVALERESRRAALEEEVGRALAEASDFCKLNRLPEAWLSFQRARGLQAGGEVGVGVRRLVTRWDADLQLCSRLEAIRLEAAVISGDVDGTVVDGAYREAFHEYGLNVDASDPEEASGRIRELPIRPLLVAALDDWVRVKWSTPRLTGREQLLAVARRADSDQWRDWVREAIQFANRKALVELAEARGLSTQPPATTMLLAMALDRSGEPALAIEVLRQGQRHYPGDFWLNIELGQSLKRSRSGESLGYFQAALARRPDDPIVHIHLGHVLNEQGRRPEAAALFRKAVRLNPESAVARLNLGHNLLEQKQWSRAEAEYREVLRLRPNWSFAFEAHRGLGRALMSQNRWAEAESELRTAFRLQPGFTATCDTLAVLLEKRGRKDEVLGLYQEAVRQAPESSWARLALGDRYFYLMNNLPEAEVQYQKAVQLEPTNALARWHLGWALARQRRFPQAEAEFREAVRLAPHHANHHSGLAHVLAEQNRLLEAVAAHREANRLRPNDSATLSEIGGLLARLNRWGEAEDAYRQALRLNPGLDRARQGLIQVLERQGRVGEVEALWQECLRFKPEDAATHANLGLHLYKRGRLVEAEEELSRAVGQQPDRPLHHYYLGLALSGQGRFDEALEEMKMAQELGGKFPGSVYAQGIVQMERFVKLDSRLTAILKGKEKPRDLTDQTELARFCLLKRLPGTAAELYLQILTAQPTSPGPRFEAARAAALAGCGRGNDAFRLDPAERARWRQQALEWLRAELQARRKELATANTAPARRHVQEFMEQWSSHADFAGLRDPAALARLSGPEREAWQKLWADVEDVRRQARADQP